MFDTDYQRKHKYSEYGILVKLKFDNDNYYWDYIATKVNRENTTVDKTEAPCQYWGRFISKFGMWKSANKELKEYIEQK